jgi:CO dehydrogenase nickel-insertion accessory protein CooC1
LALAANEPETSCSFEWLAPLSGAAHEQIRSIVPMVVITVASRKGGSGKSTLTAHLAAYANKASRRCLLIDADPQGSLTLWHRLRKKRRAAAAQRHARCRQSHQGGQGRRPRMGLHRYAAADVRHRQ